MSFHPFLKRSIFITEISHGALSIFLYTPHLKTCSFSTNIWAESDDTRFVLHRVASLRYGVIWVTSPDPDFSLTLISMGQPHFKKKTTTQQYGNKGKAEHLIPAVIVLYFHIKHLTIQMKLMFTSYCIPLNMYSTSIGLKYRPSKYYERNAKHLVWSVWDRKPHIFPCPLFFCYRSSCSSPSKCGIDRTLWPSQRKKKELGQKKRQLYREALIAHNNSSKPGWC